MKKPVVAFVCVHNSCRSQMAEALARRFASDAFDAHSAGTETKERIDPDAVATLQRLHGIDMTESQRPKLLAELPPVDILVTMGCNVQCPFLPCRHSEDWGLEDPSGKGPEEYERTARIIEEKVKDLAARAPAILSAPPSMPPVRITPAGP